MNYSDLWQLIEGFQFTSDLWQLYNRIYHLFTSSQIQSFNFTETGWQLWNQGVSQLQRQEQMSRWRKWFPCISTLIKLYRRQSLATLIKLYRRRSLAYLVTLAQIKSLQVDTVSCQIVDSFCFDIETSTHLQNTKPAKGI